MTAEEIIETIQKHSLTVRCLPHVVISHWSYREGDEERIGGINGKPICLEGGKILNATREIVSGFNNWDKDKKFIKENKFVDKGGWWYVKETQNTGSTVRFNREYDKFFAPTLKEAIQLYLNSLK
jgi:hypothetical protein